MGRRGLAVAVVLALLLGFPPRAEAATIVQGWAWQLQRKGAPSVGPVSGIPSGDFAVAFLGQPDKLSYLGIGGAGSRSLAGATLELAMDTEAPNIEPAAAQMRACLIVLEWEAAEPMPWDGKPPTVCDTSAPGRFNASAGSFAFDLAPMADALASVAVYGISIEPVEAPETSFQVVFKPDGIALRLAAPPAPPAQAAASTPAPVVTGEDLEAYAPAEPVPNGAPQIQSTPSPTPAVARATESRDDARPVSLAAVYGMVAAFAGLALGGRVLANLLRSRRRDEL